MGASNVVKVYGTWGAVLGDRAMRVLVYMALVARDNDAEPWFGLGHEALAELALHCKPDDAGLRAVRRTVTELRRAGAVTVAKRQNNKGQHARYRLWLDGPSPDGKRPVSNPSGCGQLPVDNPPSPDENCPVNGAVIGRISVGHRTIRDQVTGRSASYPYRGGSEEEGGAKNPEANLHTANCGKRARGPPGLTARSRPPNHHRKEAADAT